MSDRLYRSRDERFLAGVAGGIAERLDLDPSLVRIVWVVLVPLTGFFALLVYAVMAIVVPEDPRRRTDWWLPDARDWQPSSAAMPDIATSTGSVPAGAGALATSTFASGPFATPATATGPVPRPVAPPPPPGPPSWVPPAAPASDPRPPAAMAASTPRAATARSGPRASMVASGPPAAPAAAPARRTDRGPGSASLVVGGLLILAGCWFLVREFLPDLEPSRFWPIAIVAIGLVLLLAAVAGRSGRGGDRR
jgi:phage shock protein PspC (stress-responsive transcriptional regulator)